VSWVIRRPDGYMLQEAVYFPPPGGTRWTNDPAKAEKGHSRNVMEIRRMRLAGTDTNGKPLPLCCEDCERATVVEIPDRDLTAPGSPPSDAPPAAPAPRRGP
jgi:hypothetical protein